MPQDEPPRTVSRARRFGRSLFSSQPKADSITEIQPAQPTTSQPAPKLLPEAAEQEESKPSEPPSNLSRRQSRSSLFDLFSKPKVERARGHHEPSNALGTVPEIPQTPAQVYGKPDKTPEPRLPSRSEPRVPSRSTSRLSLAPQVSQSQVAQSLRPNRDFDSWDPSPLFQAYPQAIKHGKQQGVNMSTETLLRAQNYKRNNGAEGFGSTTSLQLVREGQEENSETAKLKRFSMLSDGPDIVDKIFVLVTAGRLVQYAGHGHSNRMPEKVLHLGEKSAAFACDLIPGKHWVVQVVQSATDNGLPAIRQSRSLLSRLRVPNSGSRRNTTSFLMIFNSAEEMDSWLKAIRGVIEQLGGKPKSKVDPEVIRERMQESLAQKRLSQVPSHRFLVQRDQERFNDNRRDSTSPIASVQRFSNSPPELKRLPILPSTPASPLEEMPAFNPIDKESNRSRSSRISSAGESSITSTSASLSPDLLRLEPLKETARFSSGSTRTSRTSEGEVATAATSACSSSPPSPHASTFVESEQPRKPSVKAPNTVANGIIISRRRSMQTGPPLSTLPALPALPPGAGTRMSMSATASDRPQRLSRQFPPEPAERGSSMKVNTAQANNRDFSQRRLTLGPPPVLEDVPESPVPASPSIPTNEMDNRIIRPLSIVGRLPSVSNRSPSTMESATAGNQIRRPLFRPIPIRPSEPTSQSERLPRSRSQSQVLPDGVPQSSITPRRFSSLPPRRLSTLPPRRLSSLPPPPPAQPLPELPTTTSSLASRGLPRTSFSPNPTGSSKLISSGRRTPSVTSIAAGAIGIASTTATATAVNSSSQSSVPSSTAPNTSPSSAQQQAVKLRRPSSVQIRADPAPFLSSRNRASVSWQSSQRQSMMRSTSAPPPNVHKHITTAIALSAGGAAMGIAAPAASTTQLNSSGPLVSTTTRTTESPAKRTPASRPGSQLTLHAMVSESGPPSRSASRSSYRSPITSPRSATPDTARSGRRHASYEHLLLSGGPVQAPPIPAMNPNRGAMLRAKNSMPNMGKTLSGLPPPMPPPSCPLPKVPSEQNVSV